MHFPHAGCAKLLEFQSLPRAGRPSTFHLIEPNILTSAFAMNTTHQSSLSDLTTDFCSRPKKLTMQQPRLGQKPFKRNTASRERQSSVPSLPFTFPLPFPTISCT